MFKAFLFTKFKTAVLDLSYFLFQKHYLISTISSIFLNLTINLESVQTETICPKIWKVAYFLRKFAL